MFDIIGFRMESILTKAEYIIDLVEACSEEMDEKEIYKKLGYMDESAEWISSICSSMRCCMDSEGLYMYE